jgi:hypothetical protein
VLVIVLVLVSSRGVIAVIVRDEVSSKADVLGMVRVVPNACNAAVAGIVLLDVCKRAAVLAIVLGLVRSKAAVFAPIVLVCPNRLKATVLAIVRVVPNAFRAAVLVIVRLEVSSRAVVAGIVRVM